MKKIIILLLFPAFMVSQTQIGQDIDGEGYQSWFGYDVSLSSDGTTAAIGQPYYTLDGVMNRGRVRVYKYISGNWTQIGQDLLGEASNYSSGYSISLSSEGNVIAIGGSFNNGTTSGKVKVFKYLNGIWIQEGSDISGEAVNDRFGYDVSLSYDGSILAVGAIWNDGNGMEAGHVRVFNFINGDWAQINDDLDGGYDNNHFGASISLSSDGNILAIGANHVSGDAGQVKVVQNQGGVWTQIGSLLDGQNGDEFGKSVSLSSDGSILAVGAYTSYQGGTIAGKAVIYRFVNGDWIQIGQNLLGEEGDLFGVSVDLSSDGTIVAIGAHQNDNSNGENAGHVKIFKNMEDTWIEVGESIIGESAYDGFGISVSISNSGETVLIGGFKNIGTNNLHSGHARVFSIASELAILEVIDDIQGNTNGINVTASQLNNINGVSGAIEGVNYSTALDDGVYADENNPSAIEIQFIIDLVNSSLGVEDNVLINFILYPNPAKNQFTIQLNEALSLENITIYNSLGQFINSTQNPIINTSKLTSGMYYVEVTTNKGRATKKIVIE